MRVDDTNPQNPFLPADCSSNADTFVMPGSGACAKFSKSAVAPGIGAAPNVGPALLMDSTYLPFTAFLSLPETHRRFDSGDLKILLNDLQQAREFHYFGLKAGLLREHKIWTRKQLTRYVRRAYRGSTRGVRYWARLAKILWLAYEDLERMRYWAQRTRACEIERLERQKRRARKAKVRCARRRAHLATRTRQDSKARASNSNM